MKSEKKSNQKTNQKQWINDHYSTLNSHWTGQPILQETERNIDLSNKDPINGPLTEEELYEALSEYKKSSPWPDDIHYEFLKKWTEKHD
jgi:hypothetical protein